MKKNKLLTSVLSLTLVLSLGACSENLEDNEVSEESTSEETSEQELDTEDTTQEDTTSEPELSIGNPVLDLLSDIKENNNYSLTIEYYDWTSPTYSDENQLYSDFTSGEISKNVSNHYMIDLTYTKDVFLLEYYYSYSDWLLGKTYDIEVYVNNGNNLDVYFIKNEYDTNIFLDSTQNGYSWQTYWKDYCLLNLDEDVFSKDEDSYDGSKIDYTVDINSYDLLKDLVDIFYYCGNYFATENYSIYISQFIYGLKSYWELYTAPEVSSTYYLDSNQWDTTMYYLEENVNEVNDTQYDYQLKYHGVSACISNVGDSKISDLYTSQFN